jgi:hypothetical protein
MPIESAIIKKNKLNHKAMPIPEFRNACQAFAQDFIDRQMSGFRRLGVLGDWQHPYKTMDKAFEAEEVKVFGEMYRKGYIYKGLKPVYWCPKDETALAEAEIEYQDDPCTSIYVKFALKDTKGKLEAENTYVIIWTTTTWTLPGNLAIALNPQESYVVVKAANGERYLVAEDTTALFTVTGKTAVVNYCGFYSIASSSSVDYPAMAASLKTLTLFRGSDTGYGEGFDLEKAPTRMEALIMLIRLLGEESEALTCTAYQPFTDVPDWALPYAAYAYSKGYTNGVGPTTFGTTMSASAEMYTEFLLRALRYSSTAQSDISNAPERAYFVGVLTAGEVSALRASAFLRADVVYLSYYALETNVSGSSKLSDTLIARGVFSDATYRASRAMVTSSRIG